MESKSVLISILMLLDILSSALNEELTYKCELSGTTCTFSNIDRNWTPSSDDPNIVEIVNFKESSIPVVTKDICDTFPFLKELFLDNVGVQEIQEDAFIYCTGLTKLDLKGNHIDQILPNTFLYTKSLQKLDLSENKIKTLDKNLFSNLPELEVLALNQNFLTEFSSELIRNNKDLIHLYLYSNDLWDIEPAEIADSHSKLKTFSVDDNVLSCSKMIQIHQLLASKEILNDQVGNKVRDYPQETVFDGLKCNPDIAWMALNFRKGNSENDEAIKERLASMDRRLDTLEVKLEKVITVVLQLKNHLM